MAVGMRKKRRMRLIGFGALALAASVTMAIYVFNDAIEFYAEPSDLIARAEGGEIGPERRVRLGGLVADDSIVFGEDGLVFFDVTDGAAQVAVRFDGVLPDLFREGQGVIASGYFRSAQFEAVEILARHDENYVPAELAETLKKSGQWRDADAALEASN